MTVYGDRRMPSLDAATEWLQSATQSPAELRGRVVLVDNWPHPCNTWQRT